MGSIFKNARENLDFSKIYLFTRYANFYGKFGWKYISDIDTFRCLPRIQRLYRLDLTIERDD